MSSVNKVILVGRLGKDPEVRYTPSGQAVANFSVATSKIWKDKSGYKQEKTEWHKVAVWGNQAEICGKHLNKGAQVYLEGELETRSYKDKQGQDRYITEVKAQTVQFLSPKADRQAQSSGEDFGYGAPPQGSSDDNLPF